MAKTMAQGPITRQWRKEIIKDPDKIIINGKSGGGSQAVSANVL